LFKAIGFHAIASLFVLENISDPVVAIYKINGEILVTVIFIAVIAYT